MTIRHRGHDGTTTETVDPLGGIVKPLKDKGVTQPAWIYGPKDHKRVFFTCPVWAIPPVVFELFALWQACELTKMPPIAGGLLDQPTSVLRAWPFFANEWRLVEKEGA